jgi:hypothetical protein
MEGYMPVTMGNTIRPNTIPTPNLARLLHNIGNHIEGAEIEPICCRNGRLIHNPRTVDKATRMIIGNTITGALLIILSVEFKTSSTLIANA